MAWINIEIKGDGDRPEDIDSVKICSDSNGESVLFETEGEADSWLYKNNEPGAIYSTLEIWG